MRLAQILLAAAAAGMLAGCGPAATGPDSPPPSTQPARRARLPAVPVVRVATAKGLTLDGALDEKPWQAARAYRRFGLDNGQGLGSFPTAVRFLRAGRSLWVGLECGIPPGKDGKPVEPPPRRKTLEIWLDNTHDRRSFHHIFIAPDGRCTSPGIPAEVMAGACRAKFSPAPAGYTAEVKIDLDRFDQIGIPNRKQIGLNIARDCPGGWAGLAGIIGMAHKPDQFWTLDLTGKARQRPPEAAYRDPFRPGTNVRRAARMLIEDWNSLRMRKTDPNWPLMQVRIRRLEKLLEEDRAHSWGLAGRLAVVTYLALGTRGRIGRDDSGNVRAVREMLQPGPAPYPPTRWREAAYLSKADDTAQPYAVYVPPGYDKTRAYPLIVHLHGSGNTHFGAGAVFERHSADDGRYFKVRINARKARRYDRLAFRDMWDVIAHVRGGYNIDRDRLYLIGYSAGAFAIYDVAARHPERFAAVAIVAGAGHFGNCENLAALPVLIVHGRHDPLVPLNGRTAVNIRKLRGARPHHLVTRILPTTGHGVPLTGIEHWLLRWRRRRAPQRVSFSTAVREGGPIRNYWAVMLAFADPARQARMTAEVTGGTVTVASTNVTWLGVDLIALRRAGMAVEFLAVGDQTFPVADLRLGTVRREQGKWKLIPARPR